QLPGATPRCENGPLPGNEVVPAGGRGVGPEAGAVGLPAGRTVRPPVGLGLALAAAAAAAANAPVGLWQSVQAAVVLPPWGLPAVPTPVSAWFIVVVAGV